MPIVVQCECGKRFAARDDLAGKTLACPTCGQSLTVPGETPAPQPSPAPAAAAEPIVVNCQCGARFAARPDLAGKTLGCPKCGDSLTVPSPAAAAPKPAPPRAAAPKASPPKGATPAPAPPKAAAPRQAPAPTPSKTTAPAPPAPKPAPPQPKTPAPGDFGPSAPGGLGDLLDEVGLKPTKTGVRCTKCRADMKPGTALCIQCGYNHETDTFQQTKRWT